VGGAGFDGELLRGEVVVGTDQESEGELLRHYHAELAGRLGSRLGGYSLDVLQRHFDIAVADLVRFLAGWGLWGSNVQWAEHRTRRVLAHLPSSN
jgi:hypothetical protein